MSYETIEIDPNKLVLDEKNPRFVTKDSNQLTQQDIRKYLINFESVAQLANDINNYRGLVAGERLLVIYEDSCYKVLEGNRRATALQILLDPSLIPQYLPPARIRNIPSIHEETYKNIKSISVDILNNRDEALYALTKRHIDGIKQWSQISKIFFYKNQFDQGKKIKDLMKFTGEARTTITKNLKQYSFLRLILDNYATYYPNSDVAKLEIETELSTDFIVSRVFNFISNTLGMEFTKNFNVNLSSLKNKDLLIEIIVKISYLYWGEDGTSNVIDSRKLNTLTQINNYFLSPSESSPELTKEISSLIHYYKTYDGNDNSSDDSKSNDDTCGKEDGSKNDGNISGDDDNLGNGDISDKGNNSQDDDRHVDDDTSGKGDGKQNDNGKNHGPNRPKSPESFSILTKAYRLSNHTTSNLRINKLKKELDKIEYKNLETSSMFLMRSLLETITYEYVNIFSNLDSSNSFKLKGLTDKSVRQKELQDVIFNDIKNHIKKNFPEQEETVSLIDISFSKDNKTPVTKIINYYIHSKDQFPDKSEVLEAWKQISYVVNTLDFLINKKGNQ